MKFEEGLIQSIKMKDTAVVKISFTAIDKKYKKIIRKSKKLLAGLNGLKVSEGDRVKIQEVKPISKNKNWIIVETLKKNI